MVCTPTGITGRFAGKPAGTGTASTIVSGCPKEYGGVEFHSDAMIDCKWKVTKAVKLPDGLRSGFYAMRLRAGDGKGPGEEYLVFFVRPEAPTGRIAFLALTATYLAFANERLSFNGPITQPVTGMPPVLAK